MDTAALGIDLGKTVCSLAGLTARSFSANVSNHSFCWVSARIWGRVSLRWRHAAARIMSVAFTCNTVMSRA